MDKRRDVFNDVFKNLDTFFIPAGRLAPNEMLDCLEDYAVEGGSMPLDDFIVCWIANKRGERIQALIEKYGAEDEK